MNFDLSDEQREIKDTARDFLGSRFTPGKVRELATSRSYDVGLWAQICELGWAGIAVPEEHGGQGLGTIELALLCEEIGYACAPLPLLSNAFAGLVISEAGSDEQRSRSLPGIASGNGRGAAALDPEDPALVADADGAAVLLLPAEDRGRLVEPAQ